MRNSSEVELSLRVIARTQELSKSEACISESQVRCKDFFPENGLFAGSDLGKTNPSGYTRRNFHDPDSARGVL